MVCKLSRYPLPYLVGDVREACACRSFPYDGLNYASPVSSSARDDVDVDVGDLLSAARAVVYSYCGGFCLNCFPDGLS